MKSKVNTSNSYKGKVNVKFTLNNKILNSSSIKNEGTILLKKAFAMLMCGGSVASSAMSKYLPSKLDLLESSDSGATWTSCLKRVVPATSPAIIENIVTTGEGDEPTWSVVYSSSIPYESLTHSASSNNTYRLCLMCNALENNSSALAYIDLSSSLLASLEEGVSMLVEWNLCILNSAEVEE